MRYNDAIDDPIVESGDRYFIGYNEKIESENLTEGFVSKSLNKRFASGSADTRLGLTLPPGNVFWFGNDPEMFFIGSYVFNNPNGDERVILVFTNSEGALGVESYNFATDTRAGIGLPTGVVIPANQPVWFAQSFNKLVMLVPGISNGTPGSHQTNGLIWDGNDTHKFEWFTWNGVTAAEVIPPSRWAWPVSNRIAYVQNTLHSPPFGSTGRVYDHIIFSDILDPQNCDPVLGDFRINTGEADHIVSVIPYAYDTLVVFMSRSIHLLSNFSIDFTLATQELITSYVGCSSILSPIQVGQEVYFVSERKGVFKLSEVMEKRLMAHPIPVSDPIQPVIDRINWPYRDKIVSAAADNYLFFAVPLDDSTVANVILVFNTTTGNWEAIDTFEIDNFSIDNILAVHFNDVRRLILIQNGPPALVYLMYEGPLDQNLGDPESLTGHYSTINDMIETRAYTAGNPISFNQFQRGSVVMETLNPNVKITAVSEGVNEEKVVRSSITKDRTKFYVHGKNPLDQPWDEPKREDYDFGGTFDAQDFSQMRVGIVRDNQIPPLKNLQSEMRPPQMSRERFPIRVIDRGLSLRIENTQGTCNILATSVESVETKRRSGVAA